MIEQDALIAAAAAIKISEIPPERLDEARTFVQNAMEAVDCICARIEHDLDLRPDEPVWRAKATTAYRAKARQRQRLQIMFGDINRRIREQRSRERSVTRERKFIRLAYERLSDEIVRELWRRVDEEINGG